MKANNGKELRRLYDLWNQHIRAIKAFDAYDLDTFLTTIMELKLDETTKLKWMEHSNDSQKTPPYFELLDFLDMHARHHESVTSEHKQLTSELKPQITTHRTYAATVGREEGCVARAGKVTIY